MEMWHIMSLSADSAELFVTFCLIASNGGAFVLNHASQVDLCIFCTVKLSMVIYS